MDDFPVTKDMVDASVNHGLLRVIFLVPETDTEAGYSIDIHLPTVPPQGTRFAVGYNAYIVGSPLWVIFEGAFVPWTLQVQVPLVRVPQS
jgi:hypothetical protein